MIALLRQIERFSCVSFDVFDTALFRSVAEPQDLFGLVEAEYAHRHPAASRFDLARERVEAEMRARVRSHRVRESWEVTLDEIYAELVLPPEWDRDELLQLEVAAEALVCRANPYMHEIWRAARSLGKRVLFLSDMYLPERTLRILLEESGYEAPAVHISSTYRLHKGDGSLYRRALADLNIAPSELVHIGDHPISDFYMAMREGVTPYYYERCGALAERTSLIRFRHGSPAYSIYRALIVQRRFAYRPERGPRDLLEDFGYERVGLFAASLAHAQLIELLHAASVPRTLVPRFEHFAALAEGAGGTLVEQAIARGAAAFIADFTPLVRRYAWLRVAPDLAVLPLRQALAEGWAP